MSESGFTGLEDELDFIPRMKIISVLILKIQKSRKS